VFAPGSLSTHPSWWRSVWFRSERFFGDPDSPPAASGRAGSGVGRLTYPFYLLHMQIGCVLYIAAPGNAEWEIPVVVTAIAIFPG
jgi:peptidoglycan/LPS O-acetylase OafA/YrhL